MKILEALAPVDRDNWPLLWEAIAYVLEEKYPTHTEKYLYFDLTFDKMPYLERYRLSEPEEATARIGPLLGGTRELPTLVLSAKYADYPYDEGTECYEQVIVVSVKASIWDRTAYKTREVGGAVYMIRGEDPKSFKFGDTKRLSKTIEA